MGPGVRKEFKGKVTVTAGVSTQDLDGEIGLQKGGGEPREAEATSQARWEQECASLECSIRESAFKLGQVCVCFLY